MVTSMTANKTTRQFVKYGIVGALGAATHLTIVWLLTEFAGLWYMARVGIAAGTVWIINFTLNKHWTFRDKG